MARQVIVQNLSRRIDSPARVPYGDSFMVRLRGLMFRRHLSRDDGLLLVEKIDSRLETSIHMFFVSFDLAVFWINSQMNVVDKVLAKSWRPVYVPRAPARFTLEIHPQRLNDFEIGDRVEIQDG